ncbi:hypothetical protein SJAG_00723 [Schizosaccharomyces japonicus yFS275]|uniref:Uncharacterized protein n=1 Tax=Schizosaccharomyces japonicus (strain yFS275 / FY16936) TaxID=402676 RepID=B6JWE7_SCHJY|nr:hypothetical protein SJAG_00723 [Schizosaccharomyces japonicus yFS275]EEB05698.1 hypothetical protein SJAG_00723 [Schizosaccharomyces japonicus yFS275]
MVQSLPDSVWDSIRGTIEEFINDTEHVCTELGYEMGPEGIQSFITETLNTRKFDLTSEAEKLKTQCAQLLDSISIMTSAMHMEFEAEVEPPLKQCFRRLSREKEAFEHTFLEKQETAHDLYSKLKALYEELGEKCVISQFDGKMFSDVSDEFLNTLQQTVEKAAAEVHERTELIHKLHDKIRRYHDVLGIRKTLPSKTIYLSNVRSLVDQARRLKSEYHERKERKERIVTDVHSLLTSLKIKPNIRVSESDLSVNALKAWELERRRLLGISNIRCKKEIEVLQQKHATLSKVLFISRKTHKQVAAETSSDDLRPIVESLKQTINHMTVELRLRADLTPLVKRYLTMEKQLIGLNGHERTTNKSRLSHSKLRKDFLILRAQLAIKLQDWEEENETVFYVFGQPLKQMLHQPLQLEEDEPEPKAAQDKKPVPVLTSRIKRPSVFHRLSKPRTKNEAVPANRYSPSPSRLPALSRCSSASTTSTSNSSFSHRPSEKNTPVKNTEKEIPEVHRPYSSFSRTLREMLHEVVNNKNAHRLSEDFDKPRSSITPFQRIFSRDMDEWETCSSLVDPNESFDSLNSQLSAMGISSESSFEPQQ